MLNMVSFLSGCHALSATLHSTHTSYTHTNLHAHKKRFRCCTPRRSIEHDMNLFNKANFVYTFTPCSTIHICIRLAINHYACARMPWANDVACHECKFKPCTYTRVYAVDMSWVSKCLFDTKWAYMRWWRKREFYESGSKPYIHFRHFVLHEKGFALRQGTAVRMFAYFMYSQTLLAYMPKRLWDD